MKTKPVKKMSKNSKKVSLSKNFSESLNKQPICEEKCASHNVNQLEDDLLSQLLSLNFSLNDVKPQSNWNELLTKFKNEFNEFDIDFAQVEQESSLNAVENTVNLKRQQNEALAKESYKSMRQLMEDTADIVRLGNNHLSEQEKEVKRLEGEIERQEVRQEKLDSQLQAQEQELCNLQKELLEVENTNNRINLLQQQVKILVNKRIEMEQDVHAYKSHGELFLDTLKNHLRSAHERHGLSFEEQPEITSICHMLNHLNTLDGKFTHLRETNEKDLINTQQKITSALKIQEDKRCTFSKIGEYVKLSTSFAQNHEQHKLMMDKEKAQKDRFIKLQDEFEEHKRKAAMRTANATINKENLIEQLNNQRKALASWQSKQEQDDQALLARVAALREKHKESVDKEQWVTQQLQQQRAHLQALNEQSNSQDQQRIQVANMARMLVNNLETHQQDVIKLESSMQKNDRLLSDIDNLKKNLHCDLLTENSEEATCRSQLVSNNLNLESHRIQFRSLMEKLQESLEEFEMPFDHSQQDNLVQQMAKITF